jgi:glycosyltransferase involved in cell wall biosynthesis
MNHRRTFVSILVPCFNAAPYITAAVQSALDQTWPDKEIIVVDDGSTDGSGEILDRLQVHGVKVVHQQNRGQCAAANRAFRESRGDYIKFLDADDILAPTTIELQMKRLADSETAIASCEWGRFYNDDVASFRLNPQSVWRDMEPTDWLVEAWRDAKPMMQCALWLMPRPLLSRAGLWDEALSLINDFEFFARVLCHASEVRFTPGARLYYRSGIPGTLSSQKTRKAMESAFWSVVRGTSHLLERRNDTAARRSCANIMQEFIYTSYPDHIDLQRNLQSRIRSLGGSLLEPDGSPRFHKLRRFVGWKAARLIQRHAAKRRNGSTFPGRTHVAPNVV